MEFHLMLIDSTQIDGVISPCVEQLCSRTETHVAHAQILILNGRIDIGLRERQHTHVAQFTPHIIDVRTERQPVTYIKTQTTVHLADVSVAGIVGCIVIIGIDRITQLDIVSHRTIRQQTKGHGHPAFIQRELHGDVLQVSVRFVFHSSRIAVTAPVGTRSQIEHERQCITCRIRSRLRRVDGAVVTHTETNSAHRAVACRNVLVEVSVRVTRIRRTGHVLSHHRHAQQQRTDQ